MRHSLVCFIQLKTTKCKHILLYMTDEKTLMNYDCSQFTTQVHMMHYKYVIPSTGMGI